MIATMLPRIPSFLIIRSLVRSLYSSKSHRGEFNIREDIQHSMNKIIQTVELLEILSEPDIYYFVQSISSVSWFLLDFFLFLIEIIA